MINEYKKYSRINQVLESGLLKPLVDVSLAAISLLGLTYLGCYLAINSNQEQQTIQMTARNFVDYEKALEKSFSKERVSINSSLPEEQFKTKSLEGITKPQEQIEN
jgi:hypothetical protein